MKKNDFVFAALLLALPLFAFADTPMPGIKMPDNIRNLLSRMEETSRDGNVARIIQQRKAAILSAKSGKGHSVLNASAMAVPLLIGTYSNSSNSYTLNKFQNQIFSNNPTGTMVDYYNEISYGQFQLSGQTHGWYTAPQTRAFYVGSQSGLTGGGARFALDLVKAADATVDFSRFDSDNDGYVDVVMIVHTGPGAETQPANVRDNIWSHRWNFSSARYFYPAIMPQGVYTTNDPRPGFPGQFIKINDYIIQPELKSYYNNGLIDIGVFCHEFGHALGLPDLYDTDYSSAGIGNWCLMASGSYGSDGAHPQTPAHMSAWCKEELGWVVPTTVTEDLYGVEIPNSEEYSGAVYKLWKNGTPTTEYFLIENRQRVGFDVNIYNPGLLIWHIDKNTIAAKMSSNKVNSDENHKGVDLEEADGNNDLDNYSNRGDGGDIYPGNANNATFSAATNPNSKDYANSATGVAITNISLSGQFVIADLLIGVAAPQSDGQLMVYNDGADPLVVNNIIADQTWLTASPNSFTVAPGSSRKIAITIDWTQVAGQITGALSFSSNDQVQPLLNATVTAVPNGSGNYVLTVSIDTIEVNAAGGLASFDVLNAGTGTLNWSSIADDAWLAITQGHGGQNLGTVQVASAGNTGTQSRIGSVTVSVNGKPADQKKVTFVQAGIQATCAATWDASLLLQAGGSTTTLSFGQGVNTSSGIDSTCGENEMPPMPPSEIFDVRFQITGSQGSLADYRNDAEVEPVWTIKLQPGSNNSSIVFTWNNATLPVGSFKLLDGFGGAITNVDMKAVNSYILTNTNVTTLFIKYTAEVTETVTVAAGWNLVSVPLSAGNMHVSSVFPNAGAASAYAFANGFVAVDTLKTGQGYWLKSTAGSSNLVHGYQVTVQNIPLKTGWNLIGPFADNVALTSISSSPLDLIESDFFGFNKGYFKAAFLETSKGYWVRAKQNGLLIITPVAGKIAGRHSGPASSSTTFIEVTDATGLSRKLYFASNAVVAAASDLPPLPPQDVADIRFANNKEVTAIDGQTAVLKMRSLKFPVKIELVGEGIDLQISNPFEKDFAVNLSQQDPVVVLHNPLESLLLTAVKKSVIPEKFSLAQNYPNPFNPETKIDFSIPNKTHVSLMIFNTIGQKQHVLLNKELEAGKHSIRFDAGNLSSGLYFYELRTSKRRQVRKMILTK